MCVIIIFDIVDSYFSVQFLVHISSLINLYSYTIGVVSVP